MSEALQSCQTLCDLVDCSSPGSSVHGIFQARILEWVAMPSFRASSPPRDQIRISCVTCIDRHVCSLPLVPPGKPIELFRRRGFLFGTLVRGGLNFKNVSLQR